MHTYTQTDGRSENIMPPAPIDGGGIKTISDVR